MATNPGGCAPNDDCCGFKQHVMTVFIVNHHGCDFSDTKIKSTGDGKWEGEWSDENYSMPITFECTDPSTLKYKLTIGGCAGDQSTERTHNDCDDVLGYWGSGFDFSGGQCGCGFIHGDADWYVGKFTP